MSTTKSDIALYALDLIGQRSFSSFSYDDISRRFDMTRAAVHYHFKSKEDLGIAVCEMLRDNLLESREEELREAEKGRHPWLFLESRFKSLAGGGICPIVSMQADFGNLSEKLRAALSEATEAEIDTLRALVRAYDPDADMDVVITLFFSVKGALQYRRAMGEKFFQKMAKSIKEQFYAAVPKRA